MAATADELLHDARRALAQERFAECTELCERGLALAPSEWPGFDAEEDLGEPSSPGRGFGEELRDLMAEAEDELAAEDMLGMESMSPMKNGKRSAARAPPKPRPPLRALFCADSYGWVILLAAAIGGFSSSPGQSPVIGVLTSGLISELELTRSRLSEIFFLSTISSAVLQPFVGRLIDKNRPQKCVVVISLCLGVACFTVSYVQGQVGLFFGLWWLRLFGQGSMTLVSSTVLNLWWVKRRGMVNGISGAFNSVAIMAFSPSVTKHSVDSVGWRATYRTWALVVGVGTASAGALLFRDSPEVYGLLPDNEKRARSSRAGGGGEGEDGSEEDEEEDEGGADELDWEVSEAIHTTAFWAVVVGNMSVGATGTAFFFHFVAIMEENSIAGLELDEFYFALAVSSVLARLFGGAALDKAPLHLVLGGSIAMQGVAILILANIAWLPGWFLYAEACLQGWSQGMAMACSSIVYANYFGRANLGAIGGFANAMGVAGTALGPFPFGLVKDATGTFQYALYGSFCVSVLCSLLVISLGKKPVKKHKYGSVQTFEH